MTTVLGLQPFLIYPAVIKLRHKGEQKSFDSPQKAEDFISSLLSSRRMPMLRGGAAGEQRPLFLRPDGRGLLAGMEAVLAAQERMMAGWTWTLAKPIFLLFLLSSLLLGYCPYISGTTISLLVRLIPLFSFLEGTNGE